MRKWATGSHHSFSCTSRAWLQTSRTIFFELSGPADSHHMCKPFLPARPRAVLTQPPTSRQNLRGYSPAYHSERLPFADLQYGRATRADRGALAIGCFTACIPNPNTQSPSCQIPPMLALQRSPRQHHRQQSAASRHLFVPLEVRRRSPKCTPPFCHQQRDFHHQRGSRQQRDTRQQRDYRQQEKSTGGR